jgi:hypothetical protein
MDKEVEFMGNLLKGFKAFKDGVSQGIRENKEKNIDFLITNLEDELDKARVNHILHLILSLITVGIWSIIWILQVISVSSERSSIKNKLKELYQIRENKSKKDNINESSASKSFSTADELSKLVKLREQGILTDEEFKIQKEKLL